LQKEREWNFGKQFSFNHFKQSETVEHKQSNKQKNSKKKSKDENKNKAKSKTKTKQEGKKIDANRLSDLLNPHYFFT
jgi:uncharacterized FlaG/YvyC family protein